MQNEKPSCILSLILHSAFCILHSSLGVAVMSRPHPPHLPSPPELMRRLGMDPDPWQLQILENDF
jgi:hypothetical protein